MAMRGVIWFPVKYEEWVAFYFGKGMIWSAVFLVAADFTARYKALADHNLMVIINNNDIRCQSNFLVCSADGFL